MLKLADKMDRFVFPNMFGGRRGNNREVKGVTYRDAVSNVSFRFFCRGGGWICIVYWKCDIEGHTVRRGAQQICSAGAVDILTAQLKCLVRLPNLFVYGETDVIRPTFAKSIPLRRANRVVEVSHQCFYDFFIFGEGHGLGSLLFGEEDWSWLTRQWELKRQKYKFGSDALFLDFHDLYPDIMYRMMTCENCSSSDEFCPSCLSSCRKLRYYRFHEIRATRDTDPPARNTPAAEMFLHYKLLLSDGTVLDAEGCAKMRECAYKKYDFWELPENPSVYINLWTCALCALQDDFCNRCVGLVLKYKMRR